MEKELKYFIMIAIFYLVLGLSLIGFAIWVIIKLLLHFGII